jgi:hypothetical protein
MTNVNTFLVAQTKKKEKKKERKEEEDVERLLLLFNEAKNLIHALVYLVNHIDN